jgi:hypothetical protein
VAMTIDQSPLPLPFLDTSPWLQPAAYWPVPGGNRDPHSDRAVTTTTAAEADGECRPAPMLSPWPRIFPGL